MRDEVIKHAINVRRFGDGLSQRMIDLLSKADSEIIAKIHAAKDLRTETKLRKLLGEVRATNRQIHAKMKDALQGELKGFAKHEAQLISNLSAKALGATPVVLSKDLLSKLVTDSPMNGRKLQDWLAGFEKASFDRIQEAINIGRVQGETLDEIARRLEGLKSLRFKDGKFEFTRRNARTIIRTATTHTQSRVDEEVYKRQKKEVKVQYSAVLDSRTTPICSALDGQIFKVGEGARPPQHFNCRSTTIPVFPGDEPFKDTYTDFLKRQSAVDQDDILGAARGRLFRKGDLTIDRFVDKNNNRFWTLEELKIRERALFKKSTPKPKSKPKPKPKPAPKPKPVPKPIPKPAAKPKPSPKAAAKPVLSANLKPKSGFGFDIKKKSGQWSVAAFKDAPDWVTAPIAKREYVKVLNQNGKGAYARGGVEINMPSKRYTVDNALGQAVWRHEYGHIIDVKMGLEMIFAKGGVVPGVDVTGYRSTGEDFQQAMKADLKLNKISAGLQKGLGVKTKKDWVNQRKAAYSDAIINIEKLNSKDGVKALKSMAKRTGFEYEELIRFIDKNSFMDVKDPENINLFERIQIAKIFVAIERKDAQEFIRRMARVSAFSRYNNQWQGSTEIFSDLIGSMSRNVLANHHNGFAGHSTPYYNKHKHRTGTEAFANLNSLAGEPDPLWWKMTNHFAPNMSKKFEEILKNDTI